MSSNPSWSQARHVLTIFDQQELTLKQIEILNSGYLAAVAQGAKNNSLRPLDEFREVCGLVVPTAPELPPLLVFDDAHVASVDISGAHDPDAFWQETRDAPARYVWPGFKKNVVERASAMVAQKRDIIKMPWADTSRGTTVREILATPGIGDHSPTILSAVIATMIAKQPNGEFLKHGLLNDGRGNLFRCGSVLVDVYWHDDRREWNVSDWNPDSGVFAGRRVFSGNLKL